MTEILFNNKVNDPNTYGIRMGLQNYRDRYCRYKDTPTCRIDDIKIRNIGYFFTSVIIQCPSTNITLDDIKQLQIIGKGTFGYGVSLPNKIVKIIICENNLNKDIINEIEYNKIITNSKNKHFIKLLGYFKREDSEYQYYDNNTNFSNKLCFTKKDNIDNLCEIYLILEKADEGELFDYVITISTELLSQKINKLLNMYEINKYFIDKYKVIFVHGDIKGNNIVVTADEELKLIDYGLSSHSKSFFYKSPYNLTFYNNLYGFTTNPIYVSPFYDIFCILLTFWQLYYKSYNIDLSDLYLDMKYKENSNKTIAINKYLYILTYSIQIYFYQLYRYFSDENIYHDFVDIKMVKYIYNNIFKINNLPEYVNTNNKLLDDYNYFDSIMKHMLNITKPYPTIHDLNNINILIAYIKESINYSDDKLFILMEDILSKEIKETIILKFTNNNFLDNNKNNLLQYAIINYFDKKIIEKIIEKKININNINNNLETPLSLAIKNKKSDIIKLLIDNNSDLNFVDKDELSIFHLLLKNNYNDLINIIINKDIYFNIKDANNNNELQHAIIKKSPENIINILIDKVDINNINKDGYNSLHLAIINNYKNIVKKLLEKNININTNIENKKSTLYLCLENNILDEDILTKILENIVIDKSLSLSPINISLNKKISVKLIDKMIDIFDINYVDADNYNCMLLLCYYLTNENFTEYYKLFMKLIDKNININYKKFNVNSLGIILSNKNINYDNKLILTKVLIENNIDLICENMNPSLLMLGLDNKLPNDIIEKFINAKTINYVDNNKLNALFDALNKNYDINIIKKLIDTGCNITQLSNTKASPLITALRLKKDIGIIRLLIHPDIINIATVDKIYPIDIATANNDINIIGLLLMNNSVLNIKSIDNILKRFNEKECIELIKISSYIKEHLADYIQVFLNRYKKIDKHIDTEIYKKNKHIYKFLLTLKSE